MKATKFIQFITGICMCMTLCSCPPEPDDIKSFINFIGIESADFTIMNTTTGEQLKNTGLQVGEITTIEVHPGDVLRLEYTPPTEYSQYTWKVTYELFDETFTEYAPYSMEYTVKNIESGRYSVTCRGIIEDEAVEFSGADSGSVYLELTAN